MGCGSKVNEKDIIVKLLNTENSDFTSTKENEISCWSCTISVNNIHSAPPTSVNSKSKSKMNAISRLTFGFKSNNKVNNFNFQFYDSIDNYLIQYRNENKAIRCLSVNDDHSRLSEMFNKPQKSLLSCTITDANGNRLEPRDKPLGHQVKFMQHPHSDIEQYHQISHDINDCQRPVLIPQIMRPHSISNPSASYGQQRSSIHSKRNLDMIVPQGTTYDILADDNRINGNIEINKLAAKIQERTQSFDGMGSINFPYKGSQEISKIREFSREGGSLEFARLLDEKLRVLYQQRNIYHPTMEFSQSKPDSKPKKNLSRQKSANYQIRNDYLSTLSVNGKSTGGLGKSSILSLPKTAEDQLPIDITGRSYLSIKSRIELNK